MKPQTDKPEEWPNVVLDAFEILSENNWVPCSTLILGLPGETEKDLELTISLVEKLKPFKSLIVPLFLVAMGGLGDNCDSFTLDQLTPEHSELLLKCWEHNLEWIPILFKGWSDMSIRDKVARQGLGIVFSYGAKQAMNLIRVCERDYDYDFKAMVQDFRSGRMAVQAPLPLRILKPLLRIYN